MQRTSAPSGLIPSRCRISGVTTVGRSLVDVADLAQAAKRIRTGQFLEAGRR
jgi:hypothetical protein